MMSEKERDKQTMKQTIQQWNLIKDGSAYPCTVPCSYYDILLKNGMMKDPHYRDQEKYVEAMHGDDCHFETIWDVSADMLSKRVQTLVFEGLDTLCEIYLNGQHLGSTNNMHRTWCFDVKGILCEGENRLVVEIASAVTCFKEQHRLHPLRGNGDTIPGFAHVRKAFYMSGWDWGPTLPDMGIWRPVYLLAYNDRIEDVEIRQKHLRDGSVVVTAKTALDGGADCRVETVLTDADGKEYRGVSRYGKEEITITDPKLWWPNGYGAQNLYTVTVRLLRGDDVIDTVTKTIGLRTLTVSQEKDAWGCEFCFKVNGIKIFAMGANYIPEENMLSRRSREKTEYLVRRCVEAHNNLIRVWGGGFYPDDWFYDLCDRYGLIVWQDFMFGCNLVWLTEEMESTIKVELVENVKRIRHHASLGLLCGNNENEQFMESYMRSQPMELEKADYLRLYCHIMPDVCAKYAPDTFYWSSSPSSGTPLYNSSDDNVGDRHIWTVWGGLKPIDSYKTYYTRFCSEFGFESMPDIETINGFTLPEDRNLFSEVMERHQKNKNGNGKLMFYMAQYYKYPTDFEKTIYATQLMQARAIRTAVEHFRRNRGRCMGSIYWQLNDCWPVASWASIDYAGRPKALFYASKKFFAPILLSANTNGNSTALHISSESKEDFVGKVVLRLKDASLRVLFEKSVDVAVAALSAAEVVVFDHAEIPSGRERDTFLEYTLYDGAGEMLSRSTCLFVKPKQFSFPKAELQIDVEKTSDNTFAVRVGSQSFARKIKLSFGEIEVVNVKDQYFDLTSEETVTVEVTTKASDVTAKVLKESIGFLTEGDLA